MSLRTFRRIAAVTTLALSPGDAASAVLRAHVAPAAAPLEALVQEGEEGSAAFFRDALSLAERDLYSAARKAGYPLPVVHHDKDPASGYNQGSPLYEEQQRWVERNGDNSLPGASGFEWVPGLWRPVWEQFYYHPMRSVSALVFQILLSVLFAWLYLQYMPVWRRNHADLAYHQSSESNDYKDWRHSPWDVNCTQDWQLCLWGWCCPLIRWADNIGHESMVKGSFWTAFALMLILSLLGPLTFGLSLVFALCIAIYFRQRMRRIFALSPGEPSTVLYDTLLWCCCPCCALMQETRQVEKQGAIIAYHDGEARQQQFA